MRLIAARFTINREFECCSRFLLFADRRTLGHAASSTNLTSRAFAWSVSEPRKYTETGSQLCARARSANTRRNRQTPNTQTAEFYFCKWLPFRLSRRERNRACFPRTVPRIATLLQFWNWFGFRETSTGSENFWKSVGWKIFVRGNNCFGVGAGSPNLDGKCWSGVFCSPEVRVSRRFISLSLFSFRNRVENEIIRLV